MRKRRYGLLTGSTTLSLLPSPVFISACFTLARNTALWYSGTCNCVVRLSCQVLHGLRSLPRPCYIYTYNSRASSLSKSMLSLFSGDFFQLLFACCQENVFSVERFQRSNEQGSSNAGFNSSRRGSRGKTTTPDFMWNITWLDFFKVRHYVIESCFTLYT